MVPGATISVRAAMVGARDKDGGQLPTAVVRVRNSVHAVNPDVGRPKVAGYRLGVGNRGSRDSARKGYRAVNVVKTGPVQRGRRVLTVVKTDRARKVVLMMPSRVAPKVIANRKKFPRRVSSGSDVTFQNAEARRPNRRRAFVIPWSRPSRNR